MLNLPIYFLLLKNIKNTTNKEKANEKIICHVLHSLTLNRKPIFVNFAFDKIIIEIEYNCRKINIIIDLPIFCDFTKYKTPLYTNKENNKEMKIINKIGR